MTQLSPRLSDIRFNYDMLASDDCLILDDDAFQALMQLVRLSAAGLVWTYSEPGDGSLPDDDRKLARVARLHLRTWKRVRPKLEHFFDIRDGKWHLNREWIEVRGGGRCSIPADIAAIVAAREARRCTYCGATDRPLQYDHIFPVSRGGTNDPSNLTLACDQCNYSKGSKTLEEWACG